MRTIPHGGSMGTLKCLVTRGQSSAFLLNAAALASIKQEYALQSGKSEGKNGSPIWINRKKVFVQDSLVT